MDVTSNRKLQGTDARWRSHWWTLHHTALFAEQLTRTFEVLVQWNRTSCPHEVILSPVRFSESSSKLMDTHYHSMRYFQNVGLDCTIRSLIVAIATDTYFCLFCPILTLFACPAVRRNVAVLSRSRSYAIFNFWLRQELKKCWIDVCLFVPLVQVCLEQSIFMKTNLYILFWLQQELKKC